MPRLRHRPSVRNPSSIGQRGSSYDEREGFHHERVTPFLRRSRAHADGSAPKSFGHVDENCAFHHPNRKKQRRSRILECGRKRRGRSEEHTSEIQSLMRNTYADFELKKKNK